ncbi:ATP-dependent DNA helicase UvsW [Escherichia coli]|nr:UvsW-1 domain-containing protein [Shigella sonnei]EET9438131.1 ATP-dependent DNA helicase UvsW [Escherichia coli]EEX7133840.1 ATP-dependent DNA helicase UvsW [Escherichia coli]EFE6391038.1 ATP-dependent DNA helicase UvsW [Escherichia coli]EFK7686891.1 ATP-dependent DNA helicase UvsW [Escherichia coli]EFP8267077.1 ATP-dependent DNA helicase UvsW [Shigella sonnei]
MISFKRFLVEAAIDGFMSKIYSCNTIEGLNELEAYYEKRKKETELKPADDISIRDAIAGRRKQLEADNEPEEEPEEDFSIINLCQIK